MFSPIRILNESDTVPEHFTANTAIDTWLAKRMKHAIAQKTAVFYGVGLRDNPEELVGLYSLSSHSIQRSNVAPSRLRRNKPNDIPAILLGILAVREDYQHQKLGASLLQHAVSTAQSITGAIGAKILVVDPIDEAVSQFYTHYGFKSLSPTTRRLYVPL